MKLAVGLVAVGILWVVVGVSLYDWRAGMIVAGLVAVYAGWNLIDT